MIGMRNLALSLIFAASVSVAFAGGRSYRFAGIIDCLQGNETHLWLYVDGVEEGASKAFEGMPWKSPLCVGIGQIGWCADGNHKDPSDCAFRNFWCFYRMLSGEEVRKL